MKKTTDYLSPDVVVHVTEFSGVICVSTFESSLEDWTEEDIDDGMSD